MIRQSLYTIILNTSILFANHAVASDSDSDGPGCDSPRTPVFKEKIGAKSISFNGTESPKPSPKQQPHKSKSFEGYSESCPPPSSPALEKKDDDQNSKEDEQSSIHYFNMLPHDQNESE